MYIGDEDGKRDVPEPIALIDVMFVSLEPTRMPMLLSFITSNEPMFMPDILSTGIDAGLAAGLAEGIGMFI